MPDYISEKLAIKKLSEITKGKINEEISDSLMQELVNCGVIPSYIKFHPKDKTAYLDKSFYFFSPDCEDEPTMKPGWDNGFKSPIQALPFPLREGGILKMAEWAVHGQQRLPTLRTFDYLVMAVRSNGQPEHLTDQHFVRLYTLQEIRQSKQNVIQYIETGKYQRAVHSYCDEFPGIEDETVLMGMSPFTDDPDHFNPNRRIRKQENQGIPKSTRSELIVISALLQIIEKLSTLQRGRKYDQHEITTLITEEIFPGAIKPRTVNGLFADSNNTREEIAADI
jgi:hypothetical protein